MTRSEEGFWPAIQGDMYDGNTDIDTEFYDPGIFGPPVSALSAQAYFNDPINLGDTYTLVASSFLCYWDYDYSGDSGPDSGNEVCTSSDVQSVSVVAGVPHIDSISPQGGTIGGQGGTIQVHGENLIDPFTGNASAAITGSGVSLSPNGTPSASEVDLSYSIASNATAGNQTLTLSDRFGTSNGVQFTVGYPPATVTNLSSSTWTAGSNFTLTVYGTNFGTAPQVTISGASGVHYGQTTGSLPDGTQTQVPVWLDANAPQGNATVTVQPGYTGQSFMCNCPPAQADGTDSAAVQPVTPAPQIMIIPSVSQATDAANLASCTGGTPGQNGNSETDVFAGQMILLCVAAPAGFSVVSGEWYFDSINDISGGFVDGNGDVGTRPSASAGGSEAADPDLTQSGIAFYFVNPGTRETATYHWTLDNGDQNGNESTADFNIQGPTDVSLNAPESYTNIEQVTTQTGNDTTSTSTFYVMGLPDISVPGIEFSVVGGGNQNAGSNAGFIWVQVLTDKGQSLSTSGKEQCLSSGYATPSLDNLYPYPPYIYNYKSADSPQSHTIDGEAEDARTFNATMYVMWDPALPSGCSPPTTTALGNNSYQTGPGNGCTSIPIPLGSVDWSACADAIDTLNPNSSAYQWILGCAVPQSPGSGPALSKDSGFPTWQSATLTAITVNGQKQVPNYICTSEP